MQVAHLVRCRHPVAAVRIFRKISVRQSEIGLIRGLVRVLCLQLQRVLLALPRDLRHVVFDLIPSVLIRPVNRLKPLVVTLRSLQIEPKCAQASAVAGEHVCLVILSVDQLQSPARIFRLWRRYQIHHAAGRLGPITQL